MSEFGANVNDINTQRQLAIATLGQILEISGGMPEICQLKDIVLERADPISHTVKEMITDYPDMLNAADDWAEYDRHLADLRQDEDGNDHVVLTHFSALRSRDEAIREGDGQVLVVSAAMKYAADSRFENVYQAWLLDDDRPIALRHNAEVCTEGEQGDINDNAVAIEFSLRELRIIAQRVGAIATR